MDIDKKIKLYSKTLSRIQLLENQLNFCEQDLNDELTYELLVEKERASRLKREILEQGERICD